MKKLFNILKNNSELLMYIFLIGFIIMFMITILFVNIINDKTSYIRGLKGQKLICEQKYDELVQDYEKLEMRIEK